jgi:hypothetical protein
MFLDYLDRLESTYKSRKSVEINSSSAYRTRGSPSDEYYSRVSKAPIDTARVYTVAMDK